MHERRHRFLFAMGLIVFLATIVEVSAEEHKSPPVGFLVIAPDRGFVGNEEIREAFAAYQAKGYMAALTFATRERTHENLMAGLEVLREKGAQKIVALPLFLSDHHPALRRAKQVLGLTKQTITATSLEPPVVDFPIVMSETMHNSYLTSELLLDRVVELSEHPEQEILILAGYGAQNRPEEEGMRTDLKEILAQIEDRLRFAETRVVVFYDRKAEPRLAEAAEARALETIIEAAARKEKAIVVPFDFGPKSTSRMSFSHRLRRKLARYNVAYDGKGITPHPNVALWLEKQSNAYLPFRNEEIGIVFMPHGSDFNWNETMRQAIKPLTTRYLLEYAFSMADPILIERAVRKLERRGARVIIVLRVFSLESSFKDKVEYLLGLSRCTASPSAPVVRKIRSGALFYTVGGFEDSPLYAEVLLERALEVSKDPSRETVILVAHGTNSEERNAYWMANLRSIATYMKTHGGERFREIRVATWREDWPEKRKQAVAQIRRMVAAASEDGGKAIVIAARATGSGPARDELTGLDYVYNGKGFAPHPKFTQWVEQQIQTAIDALNR